MERIAPVIDFYTELADLFDFRGKVAYLPGGYGGIGGAIAWGPAVRGAKVVVAGRSAEKAEALAGQISEKGHEALGIEVDVKSVAEIRDSTGYVVDRFGALDRTTVFNISINSFGSPTLPIGVCDRIVSTWDLCPGWLGSSGAGSPRDRWN